MESDALLSTLTALYPTAFAGIERAELQEVIASGSRRAILPAATVLFEEGAPCQGFPMVLAGLVRVARGSPAGRTLELYRITPGELCVVSASCLFLRGTTSAFGQTLEPTELLMLWPTSFEQLARHETFRRFVFGTFASRLTDLMALTEAVAFQRLDRRLAQALLGRGPVVGATHSMIADELGTVREIVTRLLKRFERAGCVRLGRERIEILNAPKLRAIAAGDISV